MRDRGGRQPLRRRKLLVAGLHLVVLSSFALAQPLFDLLGKNVVFFAARGSTRWDVLAFAVGLTFLPPAILVGLEALAGLVDDRVRRALHLLFVAALSALVAMQALTRIDGLGGVLFVAAGVLAGVAVVAAYASFASVRSIATVLAPAPVVFLLLFLLGTPAEKIAFGSQAHAATAEVAARAPVVAVVLDEFPTTSIMDARGRIDAARFPGFASLARGSTWFRSATTSRGQTAFAVPAILTGLNPDDSDRVPLVSDYPRNLFTFLGGSYRMNVTEAVTRLCPSSLCPHEEGAGFASRMRSLASDVGVVYGHLILPDDLRQDLPSIGQTWGDFGRGEGGGDQQGGRRFVQHQLFPSAVTDRSLKFQLFLRSIHPSPKPALNFLHVLLPHYGWVYLPDGKRYTADGNIAGLTNDVWGTDEALVEQGWQRHLLQVGFVDRLIGDLVRRLKADGLWKTAAVVVTADHGVSFEAGAPRRLTEPETAPGLAFVPLFVRVPGQRTGRVVDRHVETVDILPTLADALGVSLPWAVDGHSALSSGYRPAPDVRLYRSGAPPVSSSFPALLRQRDELLARQIRLFGTGSWAKLYRFGPHAELLGRRARSSRDDPALRFSGPLSASYDPSADTDPALVHGRLTGAGARAGIDLAVASNGRIAAVTRSYLAAGNPAVSALVPESSLRTGRNRFAVYRVDAGGELVRVPPG